MCKKGWCVELGQEEGCLSEGGWNCLKYLKRRWKRKGGRKTDFKRGASWAKGKES